MHRPSTLHPTTLAVLVSIMLAGPAALAQEPQPLRRDQPTRQPQTSPATQPPAYTDQLFPLDANVQEILDRSSLAYASLRTYQDLGAVTTILTIQGRDQESVAPATTTFARPGKFIASHQAMNLYSDGQTLSLYLTARGRYLHMPLPEATGPTGPAGLQVVLRSLPALAMLLTPQASLLATREAHQSQYRGLEKLTGRSVHRITLSVPAASWFNPVANGTDGTGKVLLDAYFDAATFMLVRLNLNMTQAMRNYYTNIESPARSAELSQVVWRFDAGHIRLNLPITDETFTFRAPAQAEQVDSYAALLSNAPSRPPVNDEEEAERAEMEQARLPYPAPDFTLPDLAGQNVTLSNYRGKVVLLDFWATWCSPCRAALPGLQKLHEDFADSGLRVLAIDIGESPTAVLEFAEKAKLTLRILLDEQNQVGQPYQVSAIPKTFLIDRQGQVVRIFTGLTREPVLRQAVQDLLAGPSATQPAGTQPTTQPSTQPATQPATRPSTQPTPGTTQPVQE